ncbi:MAG: hypothetical protein ACO1SX_28720, partial [Actinomycetota bacterium]
MTFPLRPLCIAALAVIGLAQTGPGRGAVMRKERPVRPKVLSLVYNPVIEAEGGRRLSEVCRWNDPESLAEQYVADLKECSGGYVQYQVVETRVLDEFPRKKYGYRYTDNEFLRCFRAGKGWRQPDAVDYHAIIRQFDLTRRINRHEIDEVWIFGMPYSGLYESTMAGKGAYFCNSAPLTDVDSDRSFVLMGFNYERGVGEMLENIGHRTESIMRRVYGSWEPEETHMWNRFTLYDKVAPGKAACGNIHFAPNSSKDYEWGARKAVWSSADDWLNYPHLTGEGR